MVLFLWSKYFAAAIPPDLLVEMFITKKEEEALCISEDDTDVTGGMIIQFQILMRLKTSNRQSSMKKRERAASTGVKEPARKHIHIS